MNKSMNKELRNELLETKRWLEQALDILNEQATDDQYLMLATSNLPFEACLNHGWFELLTFEEVEDLEVDKGEDVWEIYEEYLIAVECAKYVLEEQIQELQDMLFTPQYHKPE